MYKAKQRLSTLLVACLTFIVSILLALTLWVPSTANIQARAAETATVTETLTIKANTGTLASDKSYISWTSDGVIFTNYKGGTAIRTSDSDHYRVYAKSEVEISAPGNITKIVITSTSSTYNTPWVNSAKAIGSASNNGNVITVEPTTPAKSIKFSATAQVRLNKIAVTYEIAGDTCEHANTVPIEAVAPSCTATGLTEGKQCSDCSAITVPQETVPALGHDSNVTLKAVAPTCTDTGLAEGKQCSVCNTITVAQETVPALGHNFSDPEYASNDNGTHNATGTCTVCSATTTEINDCEYERTDGKDACTYTCSLCKYSYSVEKYTVSFSVPTDITAPEAIKAEENTNVTLGEAGTVDGYKFVGWVESALDDKTEDMPEVFTAGSAYTVTEDVTLYALYSYAETSDIIAWNLVTDASLLAVGNRIVIVASASDYALGTTQNENNRAQTSITKAVDKKTVEVGSSVQIITLEAGTVSDTFAFNVGNGYLYAASSSKNYLRTQTTNNANGSWSISINASGVATIKAQGTNTNNWLRFNSSNNPPIFSCYASGQKDVSIYMEGTASTTYYVTSFGGCVHEYVETNRTEPTCSKEGSSTLTCQNCGDVQVSTLETLPHTPIENVTKEATCSETGTLTTICEVCSQTIETEEIPTIPHKYVDGTCYDCEATQAASNATLTFDDTAKRTEYSNSIQVWKENGIVVTNNKAASTNNVGNYCNPVRFYKSSNVIVMYPGMKIASITVTAPDDEYFQNFIDSLNGWNISENENKVTITFAEPVDSFTFTTAGQVRWADVTVQTATAETPNFYSASVTLKEDVTLNYYVVMSESIKEDVYFMFTINDNSYKADGERQENGKYKFSLELPPQFMADKVVAQLFQGDSLVKEIKDYSIQQYAINQLKTAGENTKLKQLLSDMLHYGAAAQLYKGYNTDNLANNIEGILETSTATPSKPDFDTKPVNAEGVTEFGAWFTGANVWFDNYNKLIVTINTTENVTVKIDDKEPIAVTSTTIEIPNLLPTDFATEYTFELYYNGDLMQTLTYSVNMYAYKMSTNASTSETMKNLAIALYNYGESVAAYNN